MEGKKNKNLTNNEQFFTSGSDAGLLEEVEDFVRVEDAPRHDALNEEAVLVAVRLLREASEHRRRHFDGRSYCHKPG